MSKKVYKGIKVPYTILKFFGHWPEENPTRFSRIMQFISHFITLLFVICLQMGVVMDFHDYELLSETLSISVPPTTYFIKMIVFMTKTKEFMSVVNKMNFKAFEVQSKELLVVVEKNVKTSLLINNTYIISCFTVVLMYLTMPLYTSVETPTRISYDVGSYKVFVYILQAIGLVNACANHSSLDALSTGLMSMVASQLDILNHNISNFKSKDGSETAKGDQKTEVYLEKLRACVRHHIEIIRYVENLEEVFYLIFLIQYLASGIVICNIGFQLVHVKPNSIQFAKMILFFLCMLCELGMYCWYGNEIVLKSSAISNACYESDWIDCDIRVKKMLIILTERSKRPLSLTAGKFTILSLTSFTSVINTSCSYFALMQRLYAKTQN